MNSNLNTCKNYLKIAQHSGNLISIFSLRKMGSLSDLFNENRVPRTIVRQNWIHLVKRKFAKDKKRVFSHFFKNSGQLSVTRVRTPYDFVRHIYYIQLCIKFVGQVVRTVTQVTSRAHKTNSRHILAINSSFETLLKINLTIYE